MTETELPDNIQYMLILLQVIAAIVFLYIIWPNVKKERWKEKFIENKTARSLLIVLTLIFCFLYGLGAFFDYFFPVEIVR